MWRNDERGGAYVSRDCSTRHEEVNRLLPAKTRVNPRQTAFFFERRAHGRRRPPGPLGVARDLLIDLRVGDLELLAPRDLVEHQRARHRLARGVALALAERRPVDARLARVDVLLHQPPRELLEPAVDFALDQRRRHLERHARGELLHQLAAHLALGVVPRLVLEVVPHARAQRLERLELARDPSRTRRRAPAATRRLMPFTVTCSTRRRVRQLRDRVVGGIVIVKSSSRPPRGRAAARRIPAGWPCAPSSTVTSLCVCRRFAVAGRVRSRSTVSDVAVDDAAAFDRLEARRAIAQPLQRLVHRLVVDLRRWATQRDGRVVAELERRQRVERRGERQRAALPRRSRRGCRACRPARRRARAAPRRRRAAPGRARRREESDP